MIKGLQKMRFENHKLFLVLPVPTHPLKKIFLNFIMCFNLRLPLTTVVVVAGVVEQIWWVGMISNCQQDWITLDTLSNPEF